MLKDNPGLQLSSMQVQQMQVRIEAASLWPFSRAMCWSNRKLNEGELDHSASIVLRMAQTQTYLMLVQALLGVSVVGILIAGLK